MNGWLHTAFACALLASTALVVWLGVWASPSWLPPAAPQPARRSDAEVLSATSPYQVTLLGQDRPASHASSLSVWRDVRGLERLHMHWFSGTREGAKDVEIRHASLHDGRWMVGKSALSRTALENSTARHVRKLGNAVVVPGQAPQPGQAFVTSVSLGGWAGSRVEQYTASFPFTEVWKHRKTLVLSPFLNISTLVRAPAQALAGGGFVLPVYHEFLRKAPELLVFDANGKLLEKRRAFDLPGLLQPDLLPAPNGFLAWFRNEDSKGGQLLRANWPGVGKASTAPTNLANRDTGIAVARLPDGRVVSAFNPQKRDSLALATSVDGLRFGTPTVVVSAAEKEYSYPSLVVKGHELWLSYTADRKAIAVQRVDWPALP